MVAFVTRMPIGFPGRVSRSDGLLVESHIIDANTPPTIFGKFVKLVSGKIQPAGSQSPNYAAWGLCIAPYPFQSTTTDLAAAPAVPATGMIDILRRGYLVVNVARGTPVNGGVVALRVTAGSYTVGDIEGDNTNVGGGECVLVTNASWTGPKDASNNAEMSFNL